MANTLPQNVLLALGGDVLQKYGTLIKRYAAPGRGGEIAYTFARTGTAWWLNSAGLLQAAAGAVPRVEWVLDPVNNALQPYLLLEAAATNVVIQNRDMTQAAWTKTTCTAALDQVGIDGGTNTASSLLATAGNATCLQAITLASSARSQSVWVKRLAGSGTINMTMDNGATWTAITVTTSWARVSIPTQTLANPTVGFRIVTNGDKIAVDGVQNEGGAFQSSTIFTTAAAVTRNTETFSVPHFVNPQAGVWIYVRYLSRTAGLGLDGNSFIAELGNTNPSRVAVNEGPSGMFFYHQPPSSSVNSSVAGVPGFGQVVEAGCILFSDGSIQGFRAFNNGGDQAGSRSASPGVPNFGTQWVGQNLYLLLGSAPPNCALSRVMVGLGGGSVVNGLADMRAIPL